MFSPARPSHWAVLALPVAALAFAGCEQTKPPTAEGLKLIKSRTATGTTYSKLEARSQPAPPRAGEVSIWDFKVFEPKDTAEGTRKEIKFFMPLPQGSEGAQTTDVLMNAWLISDDLTSFQPGKPSYKGYGSFVNGWTIAKSGPTMLWVEYEPKPSERGQYLGREMARWHFEAASAATGAATTLKLTPQKVTRKGSDEVFASLSESDAASYPVTLQHKGFRKDVGGRFRWQVEAPGEVQAMNVVALSPDRKILRHWVANSVIATFEQSGDWHLWFDFKVGAQRFIAPYVLKVTA